MLTFHDHELCIEIGKCTYGKLRLWTGGWCSKFMFSSGFHKIYGFSRFNWSLLTILCVMRFMVTHLLSGTEIRTPWMYIITFLWVVSLGRAEVDWKWRGGRFVWKALLTWVELLAPFLETYNFSLKFHLPVGYYLSIVLFPSIRLLNFSRVIFQAVSVVRTVRMGTGRVRHFEQRKVAILMLYSI